MKTFQHLTLFVLMIVGVGYFTYVNLLTNALVVVLAITIMLVFVSLEDIQQFTASFLGSSFQIQRLQRQVAENTETLSRIKSVALVLSRRILTILVAGSRWGGLAKAEQAADDLIRYLKELGSSPQELEEALTEFHQYIIWDHGQHIQYACRNDRQAAQAIGQARRYESLFVPAPDEIRRLLREHESLDEVTEEAVRDYEYFLREKRFRRKHLFLKERSIQQEAL